MTGHLVQIWRHPIKAIGRERVASAHLEPGQSLPFDRFWAVAHDAARLEDGPWHHCRNFIRAAGSPALMAVEARLDERAETVTLRHPDRPQITLHPERDADALIDWVRPLVAEGRPGPAQVLRAGPRGMTDSGTAGVTIANLASHRAIEQKLGRPLSIHRWRANLWIDGLAPWEEFDWIDKEITIGSTRFEVYGRTGRCRATESNPETGLRDADTLGTLKSWDHQDFSVKARVVTAGDIREEDIVQ
ncbi:MAG: molybdenum cofactor biosysynthesis protein [Rhodobacterales bacterium]|nr:MAG: molybdenum cofactor biosysynthesis protein [Rhodobacterales bacterium]